MIFWYQLKFVERCYLQQEDLSGMFCPHVNAVPKVTLHFSTYLCPQQFHLCKGFLSYLDVHSVESRRKKYVEASLIIGHRSILSWLLQFMQLSNLSYMELIYFWTEITFSTDKIVVLLNDTNHETKQPIYNLKMSLWHNTKWSHLNDHSKDICSTLSHLWHLNTIKWTRIIGHVIL